MCIRDSSNTVQNKILISTVEVCRKEIKDQIKQTEFSDIGCDETTYISNQLNVIVIVAYFHNGNIHGRFWSSLTITHTSADVLTQCIN